MNKMIALTTVLAALAGAAMAADTSVTVVTRKANTTAGYKHVTGLIKATVTSNAASAGSLTVDAPSSTQPIAGYVVDLRGASGRPSFPAVTLSGTTFTVSNGNGTSSTLVADQSLTIVISYDRDQ